MQLLFIKETKVQTKVVVALINTCSLILCSFGHKLRNKNDLQNVLLRIMKHCLKNVIVV